MNSVQNTEEALNILKKKGYRITQTRRLVIDNLIKETEGLTPPQLHKKLVQKNVSIDLASVYRIIETLLSNHLIHKLKSGQITWCTQHHHAHLAHGQHTGCHHVMVCSHCKKITEISNPQLCNLMDVFSKNEGFLLDEYTIEMSGICKECR